MLSQKLQNLFHSIETIGFIEWQKSNPKKRERICKKIGEIEAKLIIKEIEEEVKKRG